MRSTPTIEPAPSAIAHADKEVSRVQPAPNKDDPWKTHEPGEVDDDVRALVRMANVDRNRHASAPWGRIEKSLAPYRAILKGSEP